MDENEVRERLRRLRRPRWALEFLPDLNILLYASWLLLHGPDRPFEYWMGLGLAGFLILFLLFMLVFRAILRRRDLSSTGVELRRRYGKALEKAVEGARMAAVLTWVWVGIFLLLVGQGFLLEGGLPRGPGGMLACMSLLLGAAGAYQWRILRPMLEAELAEWAADARIRVDEVPSSQGGPAGA